VQLATSLHPDWSVIAHRVFVASAVGWFLLVPVRSRAQDPAPPSPQESEASRSTGLPSSVTWTFNFDAGWGTFGFANSLFNNPKEPGTNENLSDQWFEGYVRPALSASYTLASSNEIYGKVSAVGERTYGSVPSQFGADVSSFGPEDLYIGWRSGKAVSVGENAVDISIGRKHYQLGHGLLLFDGAAEGGSRGGYWTNARRAFQLAAIGRFASRSHIVEAFYLDKDELDEHDTGSRLWGANYEYQVGEHTIVGATYMKWFAKPELEPDRDGLNVWDARAYTAPVATLPDLSFELEYATERNGDALDANAWTIQGAYELSGVGWKPKLAYRYAFFQGDDSATPANENFDPLFPGFYDWGTWWQGEIAGEYFVANSNLISKLVRLHVTPSDALSGGLLFFKFTLDHPDAAGPAVTDKNVAFELDAYTDWKVNDHFTISVVGAYADPAKAIQQFSGRTKNFAYGMVYVGYSF
jgi:alginate export protein